MFEVHRRPLQDLQDNYTEVAQIVRGHNDVVITNGDEGDMVMVNPADWEEFKQYRYKKYILEKLKEVEVSAGDPDIWISEDEFWRKVKRL